ncbi:hypothetical protein LZ318_40090 [Saccharopolyspora indica]|uniref:hypothetical protein n=1 Tax=Saccharopolyspora indica TaxID=1229659 RepID=UPI0022EAC78B|nr:hypothetical protein [Saccharopolyspora indica]MDA3650189.1 hypothetical protein [Saccharopolyspora indica]
MADEFTMVSRPSSGEVAAGAAAKAKLAGEMGGKTSMRVDPERAESLVRFFEDKVREMRDRFEAARELGTVKPSGQDPVSLQAAESYGQVGRGDEFSYFANYRKLAQVLQDTADTLRSNVRQTRNDDESAADGFRAAGE